MLAFPYPRTEASGPATAATAGTVAISRPWSPALTFLLLSCFPKEQQQQQQQQPERGAEEAASLGSRTPYLLMSWP